MIRDWCYQLTQMNNNLNGMACLFLDVKFGEGGCIIDVGYVGVYDGV